MEVEAELKAARALKGIVILRMIMAHYRTHKPADVVYQITDLYEVRMKGQNAEAFQITWTAVVTGMTQIPAQDVLELLYYQRVEKFEGIKEDIAHYNRIEDDHPDHSYGFLFHAVNRWIQRTRQKGKQAKDECRCYRRPRRSPGHQDWRRLAGAALW